MKTTTKLLCILFSLLFSFGAVVLPAEQSGDGSSIDLKLRQKKEINHGTPHDLPITHNT